jgi:rare lipoprotein A
MMQRAWFRDAPALPRTILAIFVVLILAGCASRTQVPRQGGRASGTLRPYTVKGVTYTPLHSARGYSEEGIASWYGPGFHGHKTSNGEIYDQNQMTCAHKVLPMQTMVRVTNLENGRSSVIRVNDRGPFVSGRIIDLSLAGAKFLGIFGRGTAKVRVEVEGEVPGVAPGGELPGPFFVQVGAFANKGNAERLLSGLRSGGYAGSRIDFREIDGTQFFRVHAGTFPTMAAAEEARQRLGRTYAGAFVLAQ